MPQAPSVRPLTKSQIARKRQAAIISAQGSGKFHDKIKVCELKLADRTGYG